MASFGTAKTSAAIPAFQAIPSEDFNAAKKYGDIRETILSGNARATSPMLSYLSENLWRLDIDEQDDHFKTFGLFHKLANIGDDIGDNFIPKEKVPEMGTLFLSLCEWI